MKNLIKQTTEISTWSRLINNPTLYNISEIKNFTIKYNRQYDNEVDRYRVYPFENHRTFIIGYVRGKGVRRFNKNRVVGIEEIQFCQD